VRAGAQNDAAENRCAGADAGPRNPGLRDGAKVSLSVESGAPAPLSVAVIASSGMQTYDLSKVTQPLEVTPDAYDQQPMTLTINWTGDEQSRLPLLLLPAFVGTTVPVYAYRSELTQGQVTDALQLCFNGHPDDPQSAFQTMFSCQDWVHLIEAHEHWTHADLQGLRGWFDGAYYLFTKVHLLAGVGLSPWGLQADLVAHLREITDAVDVTHTRKASDFEPYLCLDDIRQALIENDGWELKLYAVVPKLGRLGQWEEAQAVNEEVLGAYNRLAGTSGTQAIDGVDRQGIMANAALIETELAVPPPASN
jgi:hypothetical protein